MVFSTVDEANVLFCFILLKIGRALARVWYSVSCCIKPRWCFNFDPSVPKPQFSLLIKFCLCWFVCSSLNICALAQSTTVNKQSKSFRITSMFGYGSVFMLCKNSEYIRRLWEGWLHRKAYYDTEICNGYFSYGFRKWCIEYTEDIFKRLESCFCYHFESYSATTTLICLFTIFVNTVSTRHCVIN